MYSVEANFCYLLSCILNSEDCFLSQVYSCRPVGGQVQGCVLQAVQLLSTLFSRKYF